MTDDPKKSNIVDLETIARPVRHRPRAGRPLNTVTDTAEILSLMDDGPFILSEAQKAKFFEKLRRQINFILVPYGVTANRPLQSEGYPSLEDIMTHCNIGVKDAIIVSWFHRISKIIESQASPSAHSDLRELIMRQLQPPIDECETLAQTRPDLKINMDDMNQLVVGNIYKEFIQNVDIYFSQVISETATSTTPPRALPSINH